MDGRLCVAFDQPDVKEEKNSHSLFDFGMAFDGAVCVWPVSDLYSTKRDERKSTTPNSSRSLCVCPQVSVVGRHVARASKQENWTKAFPSLSFFLPHVQLDSFFYPQHRAAPCPVSGPIHLQNLGLSGWQTDRFDIQPGFDIKSFLAFLSKSSSLPLCSHSRCLGFTSPAAAAAAESEQTQTQTPTIFS